MDQIFHNEAEIHSLTSGILSDMGNLGDNYHSAAGMQRELADFSHGSVANANLEVDQATQRFNQATQDFTKEITDLTTSSAGETSDADATSGAEIMSAF